MRLTLGYCLSYATDFVESVGEAGRGNTGRRKTFWDTRVGQDTHILSAVGKSVQTATMWE